MKSFRPPHTVKDSAGSLLLVETSESPIFIDGLAQNGPVYSCRIIWDFVGSHRCREVGVEAEMFGVLSQVLCQA